MLAALTDLYAHFRPRVLCLVGIAGGLDPSLSIGDVVVARSAYWHERGKETDDGTTRELRAFSLDEGQQNIIDGVLGDLRSRRGDLRVRWGSYGTGEKVIASELSEVRAWLTTSTGTSP